MYENSLISGVSLNVKLYRVTASEGKFILFFFPSSSWFKLRDETARHNEMHAMIL